MTMKLWRPRFSQPVKATKAAMLARIEELEGQLGVLTEAVREHIEKSDAYDGLDMLDVEDL